MTKEQPSRVFPVVVVALTIVVSSMKGVADDWSQWRGPHRDGVVADLGGVDEWPKALALEWQRAIGDGLSSPVISGSRIFFQSRDSDSDTEYVVALDRATGREVWRSSIQVEFRFTDPSTRRVGMGPRSTPTVARGRLFVMSIDGQLRAVDAEDGRELWKREGEARYLRPYPKHGHAVSPLVVDDLVVVHFGDDADGELNAYELESGRLAWSFQEEAPSYASPVVAELGGVRQIVTLSAKSLIGVAIDDGRLVWRTEFFTGSSNATTPIVCGDVVIVSGFQTGPHGFRVLRSRGGFEVRPAWEHGRLRNWINDYVLDGTRLVGFSETRRGQLVGLDASTGELLWTTEGGLGGSARVLRAGRRLLVSLTNGTMKVFAMSETGAAEVASYEVADGEMLSVPAVSGRDIVIRTRSTLALFRLVSE